MKVRHTIQCDMDNYTWRAFHEKLTELVKLEGIPDDAHLIFSHTALGYADEAGQLPTSRRYAQLTWETELLSA